MTIKFDDSEGGRKTTARYADIKKMGYMHIQNCNPASLENVQKRYLSRGLEVFVGTTAFDINGNELTGFYSIFIKKGPHSRVLI